jgi:hypothetical protein
LVRLLSCWGFACSSLWATWKGTLLSIMERVQLIKSSIQGMLIYSFIFISDLHLSYINWMCGLIIFLEWWYSYSEGLYGCLEFNLHPFWCWRFGSKLSKQLNSDLIIHLAWNFTSSNENWVCIVMLALCVVIFSLIIIFRSLYSAFYLSWY